VTRDGVVIRGLEGGTQARAPQPLEPLRNVEVDGFYLKSRPVSFIVKADQNLIDRKRLDEQS
jgi:hypothetical protein